MTKTLFKPFYYNRLSIRTIILDFKSYETNMLIQSFKLITWFFSTKKMKHSMDRYPNDELNVYNDLMNQKLSLEIVPSKQ